MKNDFNIICKLLSIFDTTVFFEEVESSKVIGLKNEVYFLAKQYSIND